MAFFDKFKSAPLPTTIDVVEDAENKKAVAPDLEKSDRDGHHKEALPQTHNDHVDPAAEKPLVRKMDFRIVPLVTALYILAFLDRSNIGNARIAGMTQDLDLCGNRYNWLLTIFYITYIIFEWQTLTWKFVAPHVWLAVTV